MTERQKQQVKTIVLPRIDGKLTNLVRTEKITQKERLVNHLLRRRSNLMKMMGEYERQS